MLLLLHSSSASQRKPDFVESGLWSSGVDCSLWGLLALVEWHVVAGQLARIGTLSCQHQLMMFLK
jgi:hypothetical protein